MNQCTIQKTAVCDGIGFERTGWGESMNEWVSCEERMPDDAYGCLVTVWNDNPMTGETFESLLPYFVGWDGDRWNDGDGEQCPFEVIAWMKLPEQYKEQDEVRA